MQAYLLIAHDVLGLFLLLACFIVLVLMSMAVVVKIKELFGRN